MHILISACLCLSSGCAPVNLCFENAETLKKGQFEVMGNYSSYHAIYEDSEDTSGNTSTLKEKTNENFGFRFGYGISKRFDLKLRYEYLDPKLEENHEGEDIQGGIHYIAFTPRYSIIRNYLAGSLDIGTYIADEPLFFYSPRLTCTLPVGQRIDISLTNKIDFYPTSEDDSYWGMNLGVGLTSYSGNWMFRPEIGLMKDRNAFDEGTSIAWGVAIICKTNPAK